jgi:hypothetical protein
VPAEPPWPVLAPPDQLIGWEPVDEGALEEPGEVRSPWPLAVGLDEVPSLGLVPAVVPVGAVLVVVSVPLLLVPVLEPVDESVPSFGGVDVAVGSDVEALLIELPLTGVGALRGWSAADLIVEERSPGFRVARAGLDAGAPWTTAI